MKKRLFTAILCVMMLAMMTACSPAEQEPAPEPEPDNTAEEPADAGIPNPMEEMSELNFDEKLGWSINGWPDAYGFEHAFIVAGAVAEVDFLVDGNAVAFRVADEKEGDVSGVYDAFANSKNEDIDDVQMALSWTEDETGLAVWYKDGYVHTLYMKSGASDDNLREIAEKIDGSIAIGPWLEK